MECGPIKTQNIYALCLFLCFGQFLNCLMQHHWITCQVVHIVEVPFTKKAHLVLNLLTLASHPMDQQVGHQDQVVYPPGMY